MNTEIHLISEKWESRSLSSSQGCFSRSKPVQSGEVPPFFRTIDDVADYSKELLGFFAYIIYGQGYLCASVDLVRSVPLFYGCSESRFFISDSAEWVRGRLGETEYDPLAKDYFQLAGYVPGGATLFKGVRQLQAGECLRVQPSEGGFDVSLKRYFRFQHVKPESFDLQEKNKQLVDIADRVVDRLIAYVGARQLLLPLSGGYDSRLLAALLRKRGFKNVLCFSYGVRGNKEANVSRAIAASLGFEWRFVEYSNEEWGREWRSIEAAAYRDFASNHCSLPHVQDWLAIRKMIETGQVRSDAVAVPGHCCVTSFIPDEVQGQVKDYRDFVLDSIFKRHFSCRPIRLSAVADRRNVDAVISSIIDLDNLNDADAAASAIMEFNWAERQSKYIANSVRVYEQFGLDWWMPLWDLEFVDFWRSVPIQLRVDRRFYRDFVDKIYSCSVVLSGNSVPVEIMKRDRARPGSPRALLGRFMRKFFQVAVRRRTLNQYSNHQLAFGGLVSDGELSSYVDSGYNIIGIYSELFIRKKWG